MVNVREITSRKDKKKFFKFPIDLYKGNPYFVPTMINDEMEEFDPARNGAFSYSECKMFLAEKDGNVVGRISAILNKAYNEKTGGRQVRFSRFDFIDDYEVSRKLFEVILNWSKDLGMNEIIGPIGFSNLDKQGLLVEGFEEVDLYVTTYNYPYYADHMSRLGLAKKVDWVEYRMKVPEKIEERLDRLADMSIERYGYSVLKFSKMKEIKGYIPEALGVLNEAFAKLFGTVWLSDKQMVDFSKLLMLIGTPDYVKIVLDSENHIIGYGFMAPSISSAMRKNRGRMSPIGLLRIMHDLKHSKTVDFYSIGVKPEYQNRGVNVVILREGLKGLIKNGIEFCETGPSLRIM